MLIILAIFLTTAFANSHEKYIDLLSEDEKQEFLNKVARRILDKVDYTEKGDKSSRELSEEELKGHDKFVQDILKEESGRVRRRRADDTSSSDESNASEHLEVEPLKSGKSENDNSYKLHNSSDTENASSLAHNINRRSNGDPMRESSPDYIKVEIVTENVEPMQKRSENTDDESSEPEKDLRNNKSKEESITKDQKNLETSTADSKITTEGSKNVEIATEFQDLTVEDTSYTASTFYENESDNKVSTTMGSVNENNTDLNNESHVETTEETQATTDNNSNTYTSTIADSESQTKSDLKVDKKALINSSYSETNSSTTDAYLEVHSTTNQTADNTLTSSATDEGTTDIFIDLTSYLSTTESDNNKYLTHLPNALKSNIVTTINFGDSPANETPIIALTPSPVITTSSPVQTPPNIKGKSTKTPAKIIKIKKKSENTTLITLFADNPLKKKKSEYALTKAKPSTQKKYEEHTNLPPYQVYEIPWPDSSEDKTFLRNPEPIEDQKQFVPIYKYSPNFAYYNPTNRRGPNAVEETSIEVDINQLRKGKTQEKKPKPNEFILQLNDEIRKFGAYKKPHESVHQTARPPTVAADSEERSNVVTFPDSNESKHPYNNMKNGLKTHIKAIRDVLYKKQSYHYSPVKKEEYIEHLYGNTDILKKYPNTEVNEAGDTHHKDHTRSRDVGIYYNLMKRPNDKTKPLKRLQGGGGRSRDTPNLNQLLIMNYAGGKLNTVQRNKSKKKNLRDDHGNSNFTTIAKILSVANEKDVFVLLEKLQDLNIKLMRRNEDVKIGLYMKVLKDLIEKDNMALKQYDWLSTTVQIQSALEKLFLLIERKRNNEPIHPADSQILKYAVFIHNFSLELRGANKLRSELRKKVKLLPRNKKTKKSKIVKEKGLLNRVWLYLRTLLPDLSATDSLNRLHDFFSNVESSLFDLHEAITNIAKVTTFKQQNWYENLKDLYLTTDEKHLRELILHISFSRLIDLIENSCENGLEKDFIQYMKTHKKESKRTLEETLFVLKILDEIKSNLE